MNISNSDLPHKTVHDLLDGKISWLAFVPQMTKLLYEDLLRRICISVVVYQIFEGSVTLVAIFFWKEKFNFFLKC